MAAACARSGEMAAMTLRDQSNSLSPLALRALDALRDALPAGLTWREIETAVGTRWIGRHLRELQNTPRCTIGTDRHEGDIEDLYVLVADPDVGRRADTADSSPAAGKSTVAPSAACHPVGASSSTEPERLFKPPAAHFDLDLAA